MHPPIAAVGLFITMLLQGNLVGSILALSLAVIGIASATPLFFALTSEYRPQGPLPAVLRSSAASETLVLRSVRRSMDLF